MLLFCAMHPCDRKMLDYASVTPAYYFTSYLGATRMDAITLKAIGKEVKDQRLLLRKRNHYLIHILQVQIYNISVITS